MYDVYFTPSFDNTNWYWRLYYRGASNQTVFTMAKPSTPNAFFAVGVGADTDEDGLPDGYEALVTHTTNGQPVYNTFEVPDGKQDFDGDGLTNEEEFSLGTNPWQMDSDGDGVSDGPIAAGSIQPGPDRFPFDYLKMGKLRGDRQVGAIDQQLVLPFVVYLTNPDGTPAANGQTVTFAATSPTGQSVNHLLSNTADTTGNNGFAGQALTFLTLGAGFGTYRVTATYGTLSFEFTADTATAVSLKNVTARYEEFPGQVALETAHFKAVIAGANPLVAHVLGIRLTSTANPAGIICALYESAPGSGLYFGSVRTDSLSGDVAGSGFAPAAFNPDPVAEWGRPDGVLEHCSGDDVKNSAQSSYADSDAFDQWLANTSPPFIQRGKGRWSEDVPNGNVPPDGWPLSQAFMVAGGVDLFQTFALNLQLPSAIYNQADVLYFSGHGYHADNYFRLPNGEKLKPGDVNSGQWKKDLDIVIFAGCALLDVTGNKTGSGLHPGQYWAKTGPRFFLGYEGTAPLDSTGAPAATAQDWARRWDMVQSFGDPIGPWEQANRGQTVSQRWNAAAIDATVPRIAYHFRRLYGVVYVWEGVPESQW